MKTLSFDAFTKKIFIKSSIEKVYGCWATEEGICSWFLKRASYSTPEGKGREADEFIRAGDTYLWEWHNWDGQESGQILEANGRDQLSFSFAGSCKVAVDLSPKDDKVLVSLRQYDIPLDEDSKLGIHVGCSNGWTFWLANLKAYLEHGILLHEMEEDLREVPDASHIFVNI